MKLKTTRSKRYFTITDKKLNYLLTLLKHNIDDERHNILIEEDYLQTEDSCYIKRILKELLDSNKIFEYTLKDSTTIPVINPTTSTLKNTFVVNPISNENSSFLRKLIEFLECEEKIEIQ